MKRLVPSLAALAAGCLCAFGAAEDPQGYAAHQTITFSGYAGELALTNFPALLKFPATSFRQKDFSDLAVTDADGNRLPYEIDSYDNEKVSVWVRIPELTKSTSVTAWFGRNEPEENTFTAADVWKGVYAAVWHLNESGGSDSTGHGAKQSYCDSNVKPILSDAGAIGRSLKLLEYTDDNLHAGIRFETSKDLVSNYLPTLGTDNQLTISGWFNPPAEAPTRDAWRIFCWKQDIQTSQKAGFDSFVNTDGKFYIRGNDKTQTWKTADAIAWQAGDWSQLVARFDGTTFAAFLNGNELTKDGSSKTSCVTFDIGNNQYLGLGNLGGNLADQLKWPFSGGGLDEFRLYNGVASGDWVKAEYETVKKNEEFSVYGKIEGGDSSRDGTWNSDAASADWNDTANWQGGVVADGFGGTAKFASPEETPPQTVTLSENVELKAVVQEDAVDRTVTGGRFEFRDAADVSVSEGGRLAFDPGFESDGLVKKGAGELVLPGSLLFNGSLALQAGTLTISDSSEVRGALDIADGATLNSSAALLKMTGLTGAGAIAGPAAAETRLDVTVGGSQTFDGTTSGQVSLLKNGVGTLTLTGENLFAGRLLCREGEVHLAKGASLAPSTTIVFDDPNNKNVCGRLTAEGEDLVFTQRIGVVRSSKTGFTAQGIYATGNQTMTIRDTTLDGWDYTPAASDNLAGQFAVHAHANADRAAGDPTVVFASNKVAYVDVAARVDGLAGVPTRYGNKVIVKDLTAPDKIRKFAIQNNAKNSLGGTVEFSAVEPLLIDWLDFVGSQSKMILTENSTIRVTTSLRFSSSAPEQIATCDGDLTLKPGSTLVSNGFPTVCTDDGSGNNSVFRLDGGTLRLNKWVSAEDCEVFGFPDVRVKLTEKGGTVNLTPYETDHAPMDRNYFRSPITGEGALRITGEGFEKVPEAIVKASVDPAGGLVASHVALVLDGPFGPNRSLTLENGASLAVTNVSQTLGSLTSAEGTVSVGDGKTLTVKGLLQESGTLVKRGEGTLALQLADESSSFSGKIAVGEGTLALAGSVAAVVSDGGFEPLNSLPAYSTSQKMGDQDKRSARDAAWLETNLPGWTFGPDNNGSGICNNKSFFTGDGQIQKGKHCAFIRTASGVGPGVVSHTFETAAADAIVRLEFDLNARYQSGGGTCSACLDVFIDGVRVRTTDLISSNSENYKAWTPVSFTIPVQQPGSHTLSFKAAALPVGYGNCEALLDDVKLGVFYPEASVEDLALDLAEGTKLDLGKGLDGVSVPGLRLKYNGQRVTGTISAETHPEFVTGEGSLKINRGLIILIQ